MAPRLRAGDWDGALRQAAADVGLTLSGAAPPDAGGGSDGGGFDWGLVLFGAIFAGIAGSGLRQAAARRREVGAVRGLLAKLRREQEGAAEAAAYPAESCPVCLEDFAPPASAATPAPGVAAATALSSRVGSGGRECCEATAAPSVPLLGGGGGGAPPATTTPPPPPAARWPCPAATPFASPV